MKIRPTVLTMLLALVLSLLVGCGKKQEPNGHVQQTEPVNRVAFTMGTVANLRVYGDGAEEAIDALVVELDRLSSTLDRFTPASDIARVNGAGAGEWIEVKPETAEVVAYALELARLTDGAFDPTVAPLVDLWGFVEDPGAAGAEGTGPTPIRGRKPPSDEAIAEALQWVGYEAVEVDQKGSRLRLTVEEARLDLGAIAKGYGADRAAQVLRERGIKSALIDLGGDMFAMGSKPDGSPWRVGVADPRGGPFVAVIPVVDRAVVTSGDYERYFEYEGVRYSHLIDPRTGYPQRELASVTVIAPSGAQADGLSTAVSVMGMEEGLRFLEALPGVEGILIDTDGRLEVTSGLKDVVQIRGIHF